MSGPVQTRVDLVDQQKAICGLYERKREREEATHAIAITADRHAPGIAAKSQQDTG